MRKAMAVPFIRALAALFFITLFYIYFTPVVYDEIIPFAQQELSGNEQAMGVVNIIQAVWDHFILICIFAIVIYIIISAMRREPDEYYVTQ